MKSQDLILKAKQYPIALGVGVFCLIIVGFLYLTSGTLDELEVQYAELEREAETVKQNEINSVGLADDLKRAQDMVLEIDSRLINESDKTGHKKYFQGLVEKSGVKMPVDPVLGRVLDPGTKGVVISTKEFAQVGYSMEVVGEFNKVMDFLYLLKTGKYFVTESGLKLSASTEVGSDLVTAEVIFRMLAEKKEEEPKKDG